MSNFNRKQNEILEKEFKIKGASNHSITRGEFEGFPCPMLAWNWSDEQMEKLAENISLEFNYDEYPTNEIEIDNLEDEFYSVIENEALNLGMRYYEDLSDDEITKLNVEWNNIK
jgi:hypothetical protein